MSLIAFGKRLIGAFDAFPPWLLLLMARFGIAGIFLRSGRTKVDGFEVTGNTYFLFKEEYKLPLIDPEWAAILAALAEHLLPALLFVGLATRFGAAGLLLMTLVIQVFVYPNMWADHLTWAAVLVLIMARGPGAISLDHLLKNKF